MKNQYEAPELVLVMLNTCDVILTSVGTQTTVIEESDAGWEW